MGLLRLSRSLWSSPYRGACKRDTGTTAEDLRYGVLTVEERFGTVSMERQFGRCEGENSMRKAFSGLRHWPNDRRWCPFIVEALWYTCLRDVCNSVGKRQIILSRPHL